MKRTQRLTALSVLVIVTAVALTMVALRARHTAQAAAQALARRESALRDATQRAEKSLAESSHALTALQTKKPVAAQGAATGRKRPIDWSAYLTKHPELQVQFEKAFANLRAKSYGPLYRRLQLAPVQIDQLDQLMARDVINTLDIAAVAQERNLPWSDPAIAQMRKAQRDDLAVQEKAVIGVDAMASLQTFEAQSDVRSVMGVATSTAVAAEAGMSYDQEDQLAQTVAQTDPAHANNPTATVDRSTVDWDKATAAAQNQLSPAQLASLQAEASATKFTAQMKQFYQQQAAPAK